MIYMPIVINHVNPVGKPHRLASITSRLRRLSRREKKWR